MTLSIGIIGCGAATQRYYLPALKKFSSEFKTIYFVDPNVEQAEKTRDEYGRGNVLENYKEIIDKVHGATVVVPNHLHFSVSMDFIQSGVCVLCEKPLAENPDEVRQMVKAAGLNGAALCVNNTRRMFPTFIEAKKLIEQGYIGKLKSIEYCEGATFGWQSLTGFYVNPSLTSKGLMMDLGPHVIDTICWLTGGKPKLIEYLDDSFGGPESVASIKAEIEGCQITIHLNRLCDLESYYKIIGELGHIEGKPMNWQLLTVLLDGQQQENRRLPCQYKNYPQFVAPIVENFLKVAAKNDSPLISGTDVQPSIEFIDECYRNRKRFHMPWYEKLPEAKQYCSGVVLVTGASGFIGGSLIEAMYLGGQENFKAGIHTWGSAARLGRFPVEIVKMDLLESDEIRCALEGVGAVVHCAKGSEDVTVEGTRNLLKIALEMGIKRFVYMSTTEVYGNVEGVIDETAPFKYTGNAYNRMKIAAEKICWEFHEKGLPVTVFRPSIVYGPFSKNWTIHFAKMLMAGEWGTYEKIGEGRCNLIYIDDLVRAILSSLEKEEAIGEAFNLVGPEIVTWNRYFEMFNESLGLAPLKTIKIGKARLRTTAMQPVRILGGIVRDHFMEPVKKMAETFEFANRVLRRTEDRLKKTPVTDELNLFSKKAVFSIAKARSSLNYQPNVTVKKGLEIAVDWVRHQGIQR